MKSVLISIQPKWCELIASGKKTVEVRKTKPKLETPFKCYIYCTKDEPMYRSGEKFICPNKDFGNGKVIGEFVCDKIIELAPINRADEDIEKQACLSREQIVEYLRGKGYAWHISDLVIYDKPKELSEFWNADKCPYASKDGCTYKYHCFRAGQTKRCGDTLTRPPQSWCYVEGE